MLKALKDCQKIRPEDAALYAPAYILQKVWPSGLEHWTTKNLREAFAKDLSLNILLDAEVSKLRDTIRTGLTAGQWDLKVGVSAAPLKEARQLLFEFNSPVEPGGTEINAISQALSRNPVERMNLTAKVTY